MAAPRLSFAKIHGFPDEFSEGKIETAKFIDASTEVVGILESFGTLFTPVVSDMKGNVDQLKAHYEKDVATRKFIEDMILTDELKITHPWLLWLKRALELIERFFFHVLESEEVVKGKSDNLTPMIRKAYDEVLKPYHGFLLQNTFKVSFGGIWRFRHMICRVFGICK
jgi:Glycolipid transfer protein (GLTP)